MTGKQSRKPSLATELVSRMFATRQAGIPLAVRRKVQLHIADSLGIGLAARSNDVARKMLEGPFNTGQDRGPCRLFGGGMAMAPNAAFLNSALIHILDYDDIHDTGRLHPSTVILPAALAAADLVNASDEVILEAVALGNEFMCKLGGLCAPKGDGPGSAWFLTQLFGYFGAALTASMVLGLSERETVSSLGLAYMQAAGGKEAGFGVGSNARSIYPAFASQGGLQAAMLAQSGVIAPASILDGDAGFFQIYMGQPLTTARRNRMLDQSKWWFLDTDIKPWPSCRLSHPYIAVAMAAREICHANPQATLRIAVNASAARLCRPMPQRLKPQTLQDAKYSIPYMTAFTLVHGQPTLTNLQGDHLDDPAVLAMAQRVVLAESLPDKPGHPMAVLTLMNGSKAIGRFAFDPEVLSMDEADVKRKFLDCLTFAGLETASAAVWNELMQGKIRQAVNAAVI